MPTILAAEEALYQWLSDHYPMITNRYSMTSMMGLRNDFTLKHPELQVDLTQMRIAFLSHLAKQCHYPPEQVAEEGFKVFIKWRNTVTYFADVLPALERLSKTYILATISNGNADVMQTIAAPYIAHSINAADVKSAKPDVKMFEVIAQQANCEASECVYCGDNIAIDMMSSKKAGWLSIWVNREDKLWPKEFGQQAVTISSLAEL
jgi:putative hydrolase of the HAD superfamily